MPAAEPASKQDRILDAAMVKFSAYGFARTSMADIASHADMSRPALYQHYANKEEIFRAMLARLLETSVDASLAELEAHADLADQLDGFLQRWVGDLTEVFRSTEHGNDLVQAKAGHAKPIIEVANKRLRDGLVTHLRKANKERGAELAELLVLSAQGLKYDDPSMKQLRRRLRSLSESIALSASHT